jgi:hypothetical protein
LHSHHVAAGAISKLSDLLRSPNRLVRTAASYGIEAILKSGNASARNFERRRSFSNSLLFSAEKWVPCNSPAVKQEVPVTPSNRFSFSLENLNLAQIIADEDPLLRDSAEKFGTAQADSSGVDKARKHLTGAIRDSVSGLSRSSIRFLAESLSMRCGFYHPYNPVPLILRLQGC